MNTVKQVLLTTAAVVATCAVAAAQGQGGKGGPPRPVLSITSNAWSDGAEVPMKHAFRGENKSPAFEFHWSLGPNPTNSPEALQTYAVIFHDIENSTNRTTVDTLHWSAFNIPGSARGLPEALGSGDLTDGTRNGWHRCRPRRESASLFRPRRGTRPLPPLRLRVLCARHQT